MVTCFHTADRADESYPLSRWSRGSWGVREVGDDDTTRTSVGTDPEVVMKLPLRAMAGVGLLVALVGLATSDVQAAPTPIAACAEYSDMLSLCFGPAARSRAPSSAPRDRASWQSTNQLCQNGLAQLRRTCR